MASSDSVSWAADVTAVGASLAGHNPFELEALRAKVCNPTASLYNNRVQVHAALEFACLDLIGQRLGVPVCDLLGGKVRDRVRLASYLFFRYPGPGGAPEEVRTPDQLVAHALQLKQQYGFTSHKLKGGVFPFDYELACYKALVRAMPEDTFRYDPNAAYPTGDAIKIARRIRDLPNDYLEDPTYGLGGLRQVRAEGVPLATNTVVVDFEQLATNVLDRAADVILLDTTFWGGIRQCRKAAAVCDTFQLGISVHSSGELGIQLATMLHLSATLPSLAFAIDAHYHHLRDDVIAGGLVPCERGTMAVPTAPGLGVRLDADKVAEYTELYKELGNYPYDRDPGRPGWFPLVPNQDFADPHRYVTPEELGI
jgi:glucarate dehydratase